jgi:hypothetical protein
LERDVQPLLRATDAYARRVALKGEPLSRKAEHIPVVPVLVTNAKIFVARYDPTSVSLVSGQFNDYVAAGVAPVNVVRFRKAFLPHRDRDLGTRTVFVVRATAFAELLHTLHMDQDQSVKADDREYPFD